MKNLAAVYDRRLNATNVVCATPLLLYSGGYYQQTFPNIGVDVPKTQSLLRRAKFFYSQCYKPAHFFAGMAEISAHRQPHRIHGWLSRIAGRSGTRASHVVFLLNPLDTKHYARAMGNRPKQTVIELIARLIAQEQRATPLFQYRRNSNNIALPLVEAIMARRQVDGAT